MATDLIQFLYYLKDNRETSKTDKEDIEFFGECFSNIYNTNSQNFQDIFALHENQFCTNGFFVEFGATDGVISSNSYLLEKGHYWTGILAEPNPVWHEQLQKNRAAKISYDCVYDTSGKTISFINAVNPDLSTIQGYGLTDEHAQLRRDGTEIIVKTVSLIDLLDEHEAPAKINYLSIDTEGSEYTILKSFFENEKSKKYNIKCLTVEHNFQAEDRQKIYDLLIANGYKRKFENFSRWDDFYAK